MAQALQDGADTVVTLGGIQSNHARATAVAARCCKLLQGSWINLKNNTVLPHLVLLMHVLVLLCLLEHHGSMLFLHSRSHCKLVEARPWDMTAR